MFNLEGIFGNIYYKFLFLKIKICDLEELYVWFKVIKSI